MKEDYGALSVKCKGLQENTVELHDNLEESFAIKKTQNGLMNYLNANEMKAQKQENNELVNKNRRQKEHLEQIQIRCDDLDRQHQQFTRSNVHT